MTAPDTPTQHPGDRDEHGTTEDRARRNLAYGAMLQAYYEGKNA